MKLQRLIVVAGSALVLTALTIENGAAVIAATASSTFVQQGDIASQPLPLSDVVLDLICMATGGRLEGVCGSSSSSSNSDNPSSNIPRSALAQNLRALLPEPLQLEFEDTKHDIDDYDLVALKQVLSGHERGADFSKSKSNDAYPYFAFLPAFLGSVEIPSLSPSPLPSNCFPALTASSYLDYEGILSITFGNISSTSSSTPCSETLLVAAGDSIFHLVTLKQKSQQHHPSLSSTSSASSETYRFNVSAIMSDPLQAWYLTGRGFNIFRFNGTLLSTILDVIDTGIFLSGLHKFPLPPKVFDASVDFLHKYVQADLTRYGPLFGSRTGGAQVAYDLNVSEIQSGDALAVLRPDGVGPLTGWHQGTSTGHSTIAIRNESDNQLHVCESIPIGAYWPRNGVQCHKWDDWIGLAAAAEYNVVVLPLSEERRAMFNSTKAWDFFYENEGNDYGFSTLLYTWLDTLTGNLLCLPPDYSTCLSNPLLEHVGLLVDKFSGNSATNPFRQGMNHRVNTTEKSVMEVLYIASTEKNLPLGIEYVYQIPEQDAWNYNISRGVNTYVNSKSMVCCVFVCNMWKAGGLFSDIGADNIQCGEQTQHDIFSMNIYSDAKFGEGRPEACRKAEPGKDQCQIMGNLTWAYRPDLNSRKLYPKMGERCNTLPPVFKYQPGC